MKKMKVGFDFSLVSQEHGGVFQYSYFVLRFLKEIDEIEEVLLFCTDTGSAFFDEFRDQEKFKLVKVQPYNFLKKNLKKASDYMINRYIQDYGKNKKLIKYFYWLNPDTYYFNRFNLDVLHIPWQESKVYGINAPVIVTVHDLQQLHFPEFFEPFHRLYRSVAFLKNILGSDQVISSFEHVKEDVQKFFSIGDDKTSICPVYFNTHGFYTENYTSKGKLKAKFNVPDDFILTPAASWPHKNHIGVLNALKILKDKGRRVFWVSTGAKQDYFNNVLQPKIKEYGLSEQVLFTDIISQEDLLGFYHTTKLVVIPTLYEAGSIPLFESMRFSIPVICSDVTSLPETIDNPEFVFDPHNHQQIADMIEQGMDDEEYRKRNVDNSKIRIEKFEKFDYRGSILDAYKKAIAYKKANKTGYPDNN